MRDAIHKLHGKIIQNPRLCVALEVIVGVRVNATALMTSTGVRLLRANFQQ